MKKYIVAFVASTFLLSSCLDKDPENLIDEKELDYTKTSDMIRPMHGTYFVAAKTFSDWPAYGLLSIRTHDVYKGSTPGDQSPLTDAMTFQYVMLTDYWALNNIWRGYYEIAATANAAMVQLDRYKEYITNEGDRQLNSQYKAEVRFLRAYSYFFIARLWGDAPLLVNNDDVLITLSKTKHEDLLKWISSELDLCITEGLPDSRPNEISGRVTKYSALALKAKVNADLNNWDGVLQATQTIIDSDKFKLYPDFYEYFKKPGRLCDENLYELQFSDFGTAGGSEFESSAWFAFQGPRTGFEKRPDNGTTLGNGWGFLCPNKDLVELFTKRGETVRAKTTFLYAGSTTDEGDILTPNQGDNAITNGKTYYPSTQMTPGRTNYGLGNNIRMLRYADVLLLNAEGKVRKGQNGDAPFNLVRKRAEMPELANITLDQIMEERRVEFACEWGERFFDLVRTDQAAGTLKGFVKGQSEFYPIPKSQIDLNPLLK